MTPIAKAREALERIERWFGEFPKTGETWPDGTPMSYGAAFGSNGERDYMCGVARDALSALEAEVGTAVKVKALTDDEIMEVIKECAPWKTEPQLNDLLTYEKSPPLFPQATYDVPSYRAVNIVRSVERRILSAIEESTP